MKKHKKRQRFSKKQKLILFSNLFLAFVIVGALFTWTFTNSRKTYVPAMADASAETDSSAMEIQDQSTPVKTSVTESADSKENPDSDTIRISETPEPTPKTMTLAMVGDILLHTPVSRSGLQSDGSYNYDYLFKYIKKKIKSTDVTLLNEEVLLAGSSFGISGYPQFNGRFEVGDAIEKAGFDVILHATNHSMDKGRAGLISDLNHWKSAHPKLKVTGMYLSQKAANKITYVKSHGIKVAILNYTYGTNGLPLPSDMPFAVNLMTEAKVKRDIKKAKKKADFIIICPHWGTEYKDDIDDYQKKWTSFFLKQRVDLVIGTHPHVIEPVKWVSDKNGHKMLVYYSLGNFVNSTARRGAGTFRQYLGGMADITLEKSAEGNTSIAEAKFIPLITHYGQNRKITTYFFEDYSEKQAKENRLSSQDTTFTRNQAKKHFKKVVSKKFLGTVND